MSQFKTEKSMIALVRSINRFSNLIETDGPDMTLKADQVLQSLRSVKRHFVPDSIPHWKTVIKCEEILENHCVIQKLESFLRKLLSSISSTLEPTQMLLHIEMFSTGLHIIGNYFARVSPNKDTYDKSKLLDVVNRILLNEVLNNDQNILRRSFRCVGNIFNNSQSSRYIFNSTLMNSLLGILFKLRGSSESTQSRESEIVTSREMILSALLRCVKAGTQLKSVKIKFNSMAGVLNIAHIITWSDDPVISDNCKCEVISLVDHLLDERTSALTKETFQRIFTSGEGVKVLESLVEIYESKNPDTHLWNVTNSLILKLIQKQEFLILLLEHKLFDGILNQISKTDDACYLGKYLLLLRNILLSNNCRHIYVLVSSPRILLTVGFTLKLLQRSDLHAYHLMILWIYEYLPAPVLVHLLNLGLMTVIKNLFLTHFNINTLDNIRCRVQSIWRHYSPLTAKAFSAVGYQIPEISTDSGDILCKVKCSPSAMELGHSSPAPGSPESNSSGIFSGGDENDIDDDESDDGRYSPVLSLPGSPCNSGNDEDPSPKRFKWDVNIDMYKLQNHCILPPFRSVLDTHYEIAFIGTMLTLLKKLTHARLAREEIINLVPTFLGLFLDGAMFEGNIILPEQAVIHPTFTLNINFNQIKCIAANIISTLYQDDKYFPQLFQTEIHTILNMMKTLSRNYTNLQPQLSQMLRSICSQNLSREAQIVNLMRPIETDDQRLKAATCLPSILDFRNSKYIQWFFGCAEILISAVESERDTIIAQNCLLSLLGLIHKLNFNWRAYEERMKLFYLRRRKSTQKSLQDSPTATTVEFLLDDDEAASIFIERELLTTPSPVFTAMLDGYFQEAMDNRIHLANVSKAGLAAFAEQLDVSDEYLEIDETDNQFSLEALVQVLELSHQYMIPTIFNNAAATILRSHLSPSRAIQLYASLVPRLHHLPSFVSNIESDALSIPTIILLYFLSNAEVIRLSKFLVINQLMPTFKDFLIPDLKSIFEHFKTSKISFRS